MSHTIKEDSDDCAHAQGDPSIHRSDKSLSALSCALAHHSMCLCSRSEYNAILIQQTLLD